VSNIRMTLMVWIDHASVVHWRRFKPATCCGLLIRNKPGRTVHMYAMPCTKTELPPATCFFCLTSGALPIREIG